MLVDRPIMLLQEVTRRNMRSEYRNTSANTQSILVSQRPSCKGGIPLSTNNLLQVRISGKYDRLVMLQMESKPHDM